MHILSIFPQLLFLTPFAPFFIRLSVGFLLILFGIRTIRNTHTMDQVLTIIAFILSLSLIIGAWIQLSAIATVFFLAYMRIAQHESFPKSTLFLLIIMSFTLIFTGAGVLAFDSPL